MLAAAKSKVEEIHCAALDERLIRARLANGLTVNFVPRKGFRAGKAMLSAKVGSIDTRWTNPNGKTGHAPEGIAHYLEHQLFKKADGDLSDKFSELGAYINAHTSHTATSYYSEFVSHRDQNLRLLFRLFFEPYFDQGLVDTERDIIIQEIRLYRDRPFWVSYGAMLDALYAKHAIRFDIAGDEASIAKVTPAVLKRTHAAFYAPSNSALTISGDWETSEIFDTIEAINEEFAPQDGPDAAAYWDWQEKPKVARASQEITMPTSAERYLRGMKLGVLSDPMAAARQELIGNMAMRLAFGGGTAFHESCYGDGIIGSDVSFGLHVERSFAYASIGGTVHDIPEFKDRIDDRVDQIADRGFKTADFTRAIKKIRGQSLRRFDTVASSVDVHADAWLSGSDAFEWLDLLEDLDQKEAESALVSFFDDAPTSEVILRRR